MKRLALTLTLPFLLGLPLAVQGCGDSVDAKLALEEPIRVSYMISSTEFDAQFFPGDLPEPNGGPAVLGGDLGAAEIGPGKQGKGGFVFRLEKEAYAVAVRLAGRKNGYWIARVDQVDVLNGGQISASLVFDASPTIPPQSYRVEVSGVSQDGRFGSRDTGTLNVVSRVPPDAPVVIQLRWDRPVDLDLQLRAPDGTMLDPKHPITAPIGAPDAGTDPGIGRIDRDSIASCVNDGLREENVIFRTPPVPGPYKIYVNPFSLCGQLGTSYEVSVIRNGNVEQRFLGRISEAEVQRGGFGLGDFVTDVTF